MGQKVELMLDPLLVILPPFPTYPSYPPGGNTNYKPKQMILY